MRLSEEGLIMPEITREELVEKLAQMANVSEEDAEKYLTAGDDYVESLPEEIKDVDGDEQLEYIYENTDLDPEIIERLADAEFEILYE